MTARRHNSSLNPRQLRFVEEYLVDLNGSAAAIRAGYAAACAGVTAHQLLKVPKISRAVEIAKRARTEKTQINAEFVLHKLKEILDRTMAEITPALDRRGKPIRDGEGNPVYKFDAANALRSLELLGKHVSVQAYRERVELNDGAAVIAALIAGRRRAAGLPIDPPADSVVLDQSGVALQSGRLPKPYEKETENV